MDGTGRHCVKYKPDPERPSSYILSQMSNFFFKANLRAGCWHMSVISAHLGGRGSSRLVSAK